LYHISSKRSLQHNQKRITMQRATIAKSQMMITIKKRKRNSNGRIRLILRRDLKKNMI